MNSVEKFLDLGVEEKRAGNYEKAIEHYKMAAHIDPRESVVYYSMGKCYYLLGESKKSISCYLAAAHLIISNIHDKDWESSFEKMSYDTLPEKTKKQLPQREAIAFIIDNSIARHIAHSYNDFKTIENESDNSALKVFAAIYTLSISGATNEQLAIYIRKIMSVDEFWKMENDQISELGYNVLFKNIIWNQIKNKDVRKLYSINIEARDVLREHINETLIDGIPSQPNKKILNVDLKNNDQTNKKNKVAKVAVAIAFTMTIMLLAYNFNVFSQQFADNELETISSYSDSSEDDATPYSSETLKEVTTETLPQVEPKEEALELQPSEQLPPVEPKEEALKLQPSEQLTPLVFAKKPEIYYDGGNSETTNEKSYYFSGHISNIPYNGDVDDTSNLASSGIQNQNSFYDLSKGTFKQGKSLKVGSNVFTINVYDASGNILNSATKTVVFEPEPPSAKLISVNECYGPYLWFVIEVSDIYADDNPSVYINGMHIGSWVVGSNVNFETQRLEIGENELSITVKNRYDIESTPIFINAYYDEKEGIISWE